MKKIIIALIMATCTCFAGPGLADGAAKFLGNITTNGQVRSDFGQYWNQITAENECKWGSIERSRGQRDFSGCKRAWKWAQDNGGLFKFHALLWGSQYPNWLEQLSVDDTKNAIMDWFDAVKKEFPDLDMIDVVNEAIRTGNNQYHSNYPNTKIIQAMGGDNNGDYTFVTNAFKEARKRWPNAVLIYNDYNTVQWQKNEGIQLIQTIKKNGAPVDAYGLQAHDMQVSGGGNNGTGAGGSCLNINTLKSTIEEIWTKTQIPLLISEYDIASDDDNDQKNCYSQQISFFMEYEHIAGITIWGYIYGSTWTTNGNSGIIKNGNDRPAMTWLKQYFASNKDKSQNTTGLLGGTTVEPEPQKPFKGSAFDLTTKIEAEDFDIPGKGKNEDGTSNASYSAGGSCDGTWNTTYREGTTVSIGEKNGGLVIGCNPTGNYFEYTIKVPATGEMVVKATVAAAGEGALVFKIGDKVVSDTLTYTGVSWDIFGTTRGTIKFDAKGEQILTLEVAKGYIDIDNFEFVLTDCAPGDASCGGPSIDCDAHPDADACQPLISVVQPQMQKLQHYTVFDIRGTLIGGVSGYTIDDAISYLTLVPGLYIIKSDKEIKKFVK
jgi:GH35 family endo-1,4-beta-xylanase